ncbi:MAG: selenium-binding protein SBP56-related protein [Acidobacteriota bacterium]|jgi:selenium-binding protein 1
MPQLRPDPSFYPSPELAAQAPAERLAYVTLVNGNGDGRPDGIGVVDLDPTSDSYGRMVGRVDMPVVGDHLHHLGWNAGSSCLCPWAPHPHSERRYLVVPGIHSSNIYILDTKPDPRTPRIVKTIDAATIAEKTGYAAPHTVHCGPDGIFVNALGNPEGKGPGGIFVLDPQTFEVRGAWERERGPQQLAHDFRWHLGHDTLISSEWGTPEMVTSGLNPEILMSAGYGHALHVWDLNKGNHRQAIDLGAENQMVLGLRPAHDPRRAYGFVGVAASLDDLSASIWLWHREGDESPAQSNGSSVDARWTARKVIDVPAEPADPEQLPEVLEGFGTVPPLVTDVALSVDDKHLYVSCWGTGELRQYDVSDPMNPMLTGSVRIGGIIERTAHPAAPARPLNGGPQMVEISRDGRRVYLTNSLYSPWDEQFYPDGINGWMTKLSVDPQGGMSVDASFFPEFEGMRTHQLRLDGGDASSDSYCFS